MENDQSKNPTDDTEKAQEVCPPEPKYLLCNAARSRFTRGQRFLNSTHKGLKQHIAGGKYRVLRGRPVLLTRREVGENIQEIEEGVRAGLLELRTQDNRLIDLATGRVMNTPPVSALPHPPMDSIANDTQNVGQKMPQYVGGIAEGENDVPELVAKAEGEPVPPETPPVTSEEVPEEVPDLVGGDDITPTKEESKKSKKEKNK